MMAEHVTLGGTSDGVYATEGKVFQRSGHI